MSIWTDLLSNTGAIFKAWLDARSEAKGGVVTEKTSTVVAKIGDGDLTYGQVAAFVQVASGLDLAKVKAIIDAKTGAEAGSDALVVAEDIVKLGGALGFIPGAGLAEAALAGLAWIIRNNGQGPFGYQYPPPVYSGRSQRPPA